MTEASGKPSPSDPRPQKPWPLSWILILILAYIAFQTAYYLFFAD